MTKITPRTFPCRKRCIFSSSYRKAETLEITQDMQCSRQPLMVYRVYTFAVYIDSSIYVPGEPGVMDYFGVGPTAAELGLSLYVLACKSFVFALYSI